MIGCRLTVTGIPEAIAGADKAEQLLLQYTADALNWFGREVTEDAIEDHPYEDQTGALTESIGYTVETWSLRTIQVNIFATASYAEEVEFGTAKSKAYPFLFPKFYAHIDEVLERLQGAADSAFAEAGAMGA